MSVEWEYEVLKLELWITWRFKSIEKEKFTKTKKKTEVGEGKSNIVEIMFRESEFQNKGGYQYSFYLEVYNHSLGGGNVRRLGC